MTRKKYFNNKNQCQKLPDLDRLEKRPVVSKNIKIESKYLLSFNEHIFSATETLIVNVIKLNIAHYKEHKAQSNLILYKECATLKKEFMTVLKKFRIDQITYTNLQKRDSFKLMAIQSLKTFDKFLHRTFSILKGILNRCYYMEHQLDNFFEKKKIISLYNESICLEIRKYANALHYHFTNIDFEIKTNKYFNEKLNNITIDVQSFYDKAMSKFIYPNNAWNDKLKSESLTFYDENVGPHDDIELIQKYQQNELVDYIMKDKNIIENQNSTHYNLKKYHNDDIEFSRPTYFIQFLILPLMIMAFLCGVYYVYNCFFKRKTAKQSVEQVLKGQNDIVF